MSLTTAESLFARTTPEPNTGCWIWTGAHYWDGYGAASLKHKAYKAHRLALILIGVEVPKGSFVCHRCDNKACINPDHLYVGDRHTNARDAIARGRQPRGPELGSRIREGIVGHPERIATRSRLGKRPENLARLAAVSRARAERLRALKVEAVLGVSCQ